MIRTSLEDQRLFLICSTDANSSTNPPPKTPLLRSILSRLVLVFILSDHKNTPPPPTLSHSVCRMEIRSIHFFRAGMDRSVDG